MNVLVTGATGSLGSRLVPALLTAGYRVAILKRSTSDVRRIAAFLPSVAAFDTDSTDLDRPFRECGPFDAVIHTATSYGRSRESASRVLAANAVFPLRLLEAAVAGGVGTFFNTDTYFGKKACFPDYLSFYVLSKRHFAEWGKLFSSSGAIRFVNVRLEHVYGPGDSEHKFTASVIGRCLAGVPEIPLTPGGQKRDFIHVDDVVSAYLVLLDKVAGTGAFHQQFEVGTGKAVSVREFAETARRLAGSTTVLAFGSLPYRPGEIMESTADIRSLRELGWDYQIGLEEGIKRVIQDLRKDRRRDDDT